MGLFSKRQKLPYNIVNMMERFGRFEFDPQGSGEDMGSIWMELQWPLQPLAEADPEGFLVALAAAVVPVGGLAAYGGSRTLWEFFSSKQSFHQHPAYKAIMDAALTFLRARRVPLMDLRGYEKVHWLNNGGTYETWLPQIAATALSKVPNSPEAWVEIGIVHIQNARYAEALATYDYALILNPNYIDAWNNKAVILRILGNLQEAEFAEQRVRELRG